MHTLVCKSSLRQTFHDRPDAEQIDWLGTDYYKRRKSCVIARERSDRSDLKHCEIATLVSVARNDNVTRFSAFVLVLMSRCI